MYGLIAIKMYYHQVRIQGKINLNISVTSTLSNES